MGGVIFITKISLFRSTQHLISLETPNTQIIEVFLLRISLGDVNASVVVTCQYPQIY